MIEALQQMYMNTQGKPVELTFESDGKRRRIILEAGAVFDAKFYKASNVLVNGKPLFDAELKHLGDIVKQAVILDIETTGKIGGSVITEASLFNVEQNVVDVFYTKPYHMVNLTADDMELASMSSKVDRSSINIRSRVTPRSHAASFFTKHLSDIFRDPIEFRKIALAMPKDVAKKLGSIRFRDVKSDVLVGNRLTFEEGVLRDDLKHDLFRKGFLRDYLLKYTAERDPFQTRYYLESAEEAERLGIKRTLFGDASDEEVHRLMSYVRDPSRLESTSELLKRSEEVEAMFRERYGSDVKVRSHYVDTDEMVERLVRGMQGKSVHAAYALFESKQFGALIRGSITQQLLDEDPELLDKTPKEINKLVEQRLREQGNPFERVIAGVSYTGDPFYTTGEEYNIQKAVAQRKNTFVNLLGEYLRSTGPKQVRDIQDVQKIVQGSIHRLGLQDIPKPQAMSVEVQARLFGAAQAIADTPGLDLDLILRKIKEKEAHISAADAAVSSPKLIASGLEFAVAGEEFYKQTPLGGHFYKEALQGRGPLMGLFAYGKLSDYYSRTLAEDDLGLMDILYEQRIARNMQSAVDSSNFSTFGNVEGTSFLQVPTYTVDESGKRVQVTRTVGYANTRTYKGMQGIYSSSRVFAEDYAGVEAERSINRLMSKVNADELLVEFDTQQQRYVFPEISATASAYEKREYALRMSKIRSRLDSLVESNQEQVKLFQRRIGANINEGVQQVIRSIPEELRRSKILEEMERTSKNVSSRNSLERALGNHSALEGAKRILLPVMGLGLAMTGLSTLESFQQPERSSYLIPSYSDWFESQAQMFGSSEAFTRAMREKTGYIEGMQESGFSSMLRKFNSDFGSPYTGPSYSNDTLRYNELLRERQRKLRYNYTARHLNFDGDVRNLIGRFISNTFKPSEQFAENQTRAILSSSSLGAQSYTSLRGQNLTKVSISGNYNINVEDADTITLQRNLGSGPMKNFFFGRKNSSSMSIRLAGIDSPEVAHQNRGAQPYAEAAKRIAQDMISRAKNVEVVFDDKDSTYGRRVGVLYADGVNVNLELIKRGAAAYLPYRSKQGRPIYDQQEFSAAEETAYKSKRGMWRTDYFRSYKQIAQASGQTVTFNTLVNPSKVADNTSLMTMYSAMKTAENFGMQHTEAQMAVADAAFTLGEKAKSSRDNIFKPDFNKNEWLDPSMAVTKPTNTVLSSMYELKSDLNKLITTKGSSVYNKHSALNTKALDIDLAKELSSPTHNSFNKDYGFSQVDRKRKLIRLKTMEMLQQREAHRMFNRSTGHHRM